MEKIKKQEQPKKPDQKHPVPPFPKQQESSPPGKENDLQARADHAASYISGATIPVTGGRITI